MHCLRRCFPWEAVPSKELATRVHALEEQGRAYFPPSCDPQQDSEALDYPLEALSSRVRAIEERQQAQQQAATEEISRAVSLAEHAISAAQADAREQVLAFREDAEARISAVEQKAALRIAAAEERSRQAPPPPPSPPTLCTGGVAVSLSARASPDLLLAVPAARAPTLAASPPSSAPRPVQGKPVGGGVPMATVASVDDAFERITVEGSQAARQTETSVSPREIQTAVCLILSDEPVTHALSDVEGSARDGMAKAVAADRAAPAAPLSTPSATPPAVRTTTTMGPPARCLRQQGCGYPDCSASFLEARGAGSGDGSPSHLAAPLPPTPFKPKNRIARSPQR